jgi:hypothetical protein
MAQNENFFCLFLLAQEEKDFPIFIGSNGIFTSSSPTPPLTFFRLIFHARGVRRRSFGRRSF